MLCYGGPTANLMHAIYYIIWIQSKHRFYVSPFYLYVNMSVYTH